MESKENLENAQVYIDFVKNNLQPLADHLKVSVEWLWNILVQQARVEAIVYLVVIVLLTVKVAVLALIAFKAMRQATFGDGRTRAVYKHKETGAEIRSLLDDWDHRDDYETVTSTPVTNFHGRLVYYTGIPALILTAFLVILTPIVLPTIVTGLVNPEYRAIEKIVEFAKPKVEQVTESAS